jgi:glycerophosphoryl diester phosphodiesterase
VAFLVAHRAGNDLARLREAEGAGAELVEADVRLWRGRPEVRHLKSLGPLPILWDRWELANPFTPRLTLPQLLDATAPGTELMLDLKGRDPRLARAVLDALRPPRRITVCARAWRLLEPFAAEPHVRTVYSVGSFRQLQALLRRSEGSLLDGVSIHEELLTRETAAELRRRSGVVMTWPVNTLERARELVALGVDGLISDDLHAIGPAT